MKKKLLLLFSLVSLIGYTQSKEFVIDWGESKKLNTYNSTIEIPGFNQKNFSYDPYSGLKFVTQWASDRYVDESSYVLTNLRYSSLSRSELKNLNVKTIPKEVNVKVKNSTSRDKNYIYLELSPIIKDANGFKKVNSFRIEYNYSSRNVTNRSLSELELTNSALGSGEWHKFYVSQTGVYRLSKSFLSSLGVNVNVDPRSLKIFGCGGSMIPYSNSVAYPLDPVENAIKFVGEEDGVFNDEDYILFYAEGPIGYSAESNTNLNIYTDKTYYYVNVSSGNGKRITALQEPTGDPNYIFNTFSDYQFHEVDEYNLVKAGRRWFGDRFDIEPQKSFEFEFPNLVSSEPIQLKVYVAGVGESQTNMQVNVNGSAVETLSFSPISEDILASEDWVDSPVNVNSGNIDVSLEYINNGNPSALAYLDYISIEAVRELTYSGEQFIFKNYEAAQNLGIGEYSISNASNVTEVWDITDQYSPKYISNLETLNTFSFKSTLGELKTFIALGGNYFEPERDSNTTVQNQDIKGTIFQNSQNQFEDVDYLIVSPESFLNQAERLAEINRIQYGINVKVVELEKIYNEFSTGNQDIGAIKNLVRYIYVNASTPEKRLKYVCLFGDASFDYKDRTQGNTNFVPSWHAYSSYNLLNSFISDDFFGMMDPNEGSMSNSDKLDIAVGRILAYSQQSATELVDKIDRYYKEASYGSWRNSFVVISDDVNESWEKIIQQTSNDIGDQVAQEKPNVNVTKIHSDAFEQESSAGGDRYPKVQEAFVNSFEQGALVINYFGHGGEERLAVERIFGSADVDDLNNVCKLSCFVTVTCEFSRFDNPLRVTGGELTYWKPDGGAIALITTTRKIFVSTGIVFNNTLSQYLFSYGSSDFPSIAESLRLTKTDPNITNATQRRLVSFIGDPAMKLSFPKPNIRLIAVNDVPLTQPIDTLKALSKVKLSGQVTSETGEVLTDYNGILSATIYDKPIERQTLGNDNTTENGQLIILDFETLGSLIFKGQATVTNGNFDFDFVVPRDIGIPVGEGKVSFYSRTTEPLQDNAGANFDVKIGGLNENAPEDNTGPNIKLYMNDENFVTGGVTNEQPTLLAILEDENGINTASGIGHDIVAILDNDETNPVILNNYYETDVDVYQSGRLTYPFRDLEPGLHTLTLKAWDVYNNSSMAEIQFVVFDKDQELKIENVLNYPNPFVNYTEFWFNHNSSEPLDVSIQIFTVSGKLIRTINGQTGSGECCDQGTSSLSRSITWDGRDDFGDKIGKGVYVYKLTVRSNTLNKKAEKFEKLVIL